jgi:serpin B
LLYVANRLFGSTTASILNSYRTSALENYGSELELLDFATKTKQSRLRIHSWIASATNDKIKDMLPSGSVQIGTVLVLVNAIYFKGTWVVLPKAY